MSFVSSNVLRMGRARWIAASLAIAAATQAGAQPYGYQGEPRGDYGPGAPRVVHCESNNWSRNFCAIPTRPNERIRVVRVYSERPCLQGRNWFRAPNGIVVDDGCRGDFAVVARPARARDLGQARGQRYDGGPYRDRDDRYEDGPRGNTGPQGYDRYQFRPNPNAQGQRYARPPRDEGQDDDDRGPPEGYGPGGYESGGYGQGGYGQQGPYDRNGPPRGHVTVRDADNPNDRPHPMGGGECDEDERDEAGCGPADAGPPQR